MNTKNTYDNRRMIRKRFIACMAACALFTGSLILSYSETVEAGVIVDMASGVIGKLRYNATVAEICISLLTGAGASVTNQNYLNQLNASYGVESTLATATGTDGTIGAMYEAGLFSIADDGTYIDNGLAAAIQSQPAYNNCNINDIFGTWEDVEGVATNTASATENLGASISAGVVAGTLSQVAGSFMFGYNLGKLGVNVARTFGEKMANNAFVNAQGDFSNYEHRAGYTNCFVNLRASSTYRFSGAYSDGVIPILAHYLYDGSNGYATWFYNSSSSSTGTYYNSSSNNGGILNPFNTYNTLDPHSCSGIRGSKINVNDINTGGMYTIELNSMDDMYNYYNSLNSGNTVLLSSNYPPKNYSPDVVGRNGNQRPVNYNTPKEATAWPDLGDQTPEGKGITCIPWDDYQDFADTVNNNTTNNITNVQQGDVYNNFVTNYYVTPDVNETVETPDYNPITPTQPIPNDKPEVSQSEAQQNTDYMTTPGLKDVFPFCIPWDIKSMFALLGTNEREAPKITIPFTSELYGIDEDIEVDLSTFDAAAAILRTLELIGFAIGLAMVTRSLIGAR